MRFIRLKICWDLIFNIKHPMRNWFYWRNPKFFISPRKILLTYEGPRVYEGEINHHHIKEEIFYLMGTTKMDLERVEENKRLVTKKI